MRRAVREIPVMKAVGTALFLLLIGCGAPAPASATGQQALGDLAGHPTFAFTDEAALMEPGFQSGHLFNAIMKRRIRDELGKQLKSRGYAEAPADSASLLVLFSAGGRQQVMTPDNQKGTRVQGVAQSIDHGALVLHFLDAQSKSVIWRGWIDAVMRPEDDLDQKVRHAILEIMKPFPRAQG